MQIKMIAQKYINSCQSNPQIIRPLIMKKIFSWFCAL